MLEMIEFGFTDNFLRGKTGVRGDEKTTSLLLDFFQGGGIINMEFFGGIGGVGF